MNSRKSRLFGSVRRPVTWPSVTARLPQTSLRKVRNLTRHKNYHEIEELRKFYYGDGNNFNTMFKTAASEIDLTQDTVDGGDVHHECDRQVNKRYTTYTLPYLTGRGIDGSSRLQAWVWVEAIQ